VRAADARVVDDEIVEPEILGDGEVAEAIDASAPNRTQVDFPPECGRRSVRMDGQVRKLDTSPAGDRGLSAAGAKDLRDTIRASGRVTGESRINLGEGSTVTAP